MTDTKSLLVHITWKGWEDTASRPVLGEDVKIEFWMKKAMSGGSTIIPNFTWEIDERSEIEGRDDWYESGRDCIYSIGGTMSIIGASGKTVNYGTEWDESSNYLTLELGNGDVVQITYDKDGPDCPWSTDSQWLKVRMLIKKIN